MKNCKICKKEFIRIKNNQKYCSKLCYKQAKMKRKRPYSKKYYLEHKEKLDLQHINYYENHKEQRAKAMKEWYELNKEKIIEHNINYNKNKYKTNIGFKILDNLRSRIRMALKRNIKSQSTIKLIDCSIDFLRQHLEKQFQSGMSWSNHGLWHIDHIIPCASFDLSKVSEQRKCFHYTNLQPLWAKENLRKGSKIL
jgi:hypothetical protein